MHVITIIIFTFSWLNHKVFYIPGASVWLHYKFAVSIILFQAAVVKPYPFALIV